VSKPLHGKIKQVMTKNVLMRAFLFALVCTALGFGQKYSGPRPPKPDVPYLQHADNLVETEVAEAKEDDRKNETVYEVAGPSSPARTPLAEPIFLFQSEKIVPGKLDLFQLETKDNNRRIIFPKKKKKDAPRPLRLSIKRLEENLYRIEANEPLDNGEYSLTPAGSNQVFCFEVY
jgi:hypothetical protein